MNRYFPFLYSFARSLSFFFPLFTVYSLQIFFHLILTFRQVCLSISLLFFFFFPFMYLPLLSLPLYSDYKLTKYYNSCKVDHKTMKSWSIFTIQFHVVATKAITHNTRLAQRTPKFMFWDRKKKRYKTRNITDHFTKTVSLPVINICIWPSNQFYKQPLIIKKLFNLLHFFIPSIKIKYSRSKARQYSSSKVTLTSVE